jgi:O-methyltransferase
MRRLLAEPNRIFSQRRDRFLRTHWEGISRYTLLDPWRLGGLLDLADQAARQAGDVVECGSYRGGTGLLLALLWREMGVAKRVYLLDSYEGLPKPHAAHDRGYREGELKSDMHDLVARVQALGLQDIVQVCKGWFSDSIGQLVAAGTLSQVCLLHVDCDLYQSTLDCLNGLYDRVTPGGAIVFDDINDGGRGEKLAAFDFFRRRNEAVCFHVGPAPQMYVLKGEPVPAAAPGAAGDGHVYDLSLYRGETDYSRWLSERLPPGSLDALREYPKTHEREDSQ